MRNEVKDGRVFRLEPAIFDQRCQRRTSRVDVARELTESRFRSRGVSWRCWRILLETQATFCSIARYCKLSGADSKVTNPITSGPTSSGFAVKSSETALNRATCFPSAALATACRARSRSSLAELADGGDCQFVCNDSLPSCGRAATDQAGPLPPGSGDRTANRSRTA